ncbi:hypothetical protein B0T10DRAFT_453546 [Thelonectria olida]|uniref:Uncharacterized protein n=1 Tax=Thelonectria olida TaxID=1576542 RepID=A0A9P9AXX3_9HYPO|nr:hypothetical protein B0T10DRAFT_453546 [Thelonectria olida]
MSNVEGDQNSVTSGTAVNDGQQATMAQLRLDRFPWIEAQLLDDRRQMELFKQIITEIVTDLGIDPNTVSKCVQSSADALMRSNLFKPKVISGWGAIRAIRRSVAKARENWTDERMFILPAVQLLCLWAAVNVRMVATEGKDDVTRFMRTTEMYRYVTIAIDIYARHQGPFFLEFQPVPNATITSYSRLGLPIVHAPVPLPSAQNTRLQLGNDRLLGPIEGRSFRHPEPAVDEEKMSQVKEVNQQAVQQLPVPNDRPKQNLTEDKNSEKEIHDGLELTVAVTREDAMRTAGNLFNKLDDPMRYAADTLVDQVGTFLAEDHLELLDRRQASNLFVWCTQRPEQKFKDWAERMRQVEYGQTVVNKTVVMSKQNLFQTYESRMDQAWDWLSDHADDAEKVRLWAEMMRPLIRTKELYRRQTGHGGINSQAISALQGLIIVWLKELLAVTKALEALRGRQEAMQSIETRKRPRVDGPTKMEQ